MSFSEPFIRRPVATALIAAGVFLSGAVAYKLLPVAPLPRVDFPTLNVNAGLPGAGPETMASAVATPLERRFGRIAGVSEITSTSTLGSTSITLQFDLDRNIDAAARDVQAAINAAGGELPTNLPSRPNYRKANPSDAPILLLGLTSDTVRLAEMYDAANSIVAQKIAQLPGVGQVFVGGGQQPAVRIQVDPAALAGVGLSLEDLRAVIGRVNVNEPKGNLDGPMRSTLISADDQLFNAEAYRSLVVAYRNGAGVRLRDVATVIDSVENNRLAAWTDGKRGILVIIRRQAGANILQTIDEIKSLLPLLSASISPAIKISVVADRAQTIRASVTDVQITLLVSICLVVLVVFLFLRDARATLIPGIAVPLSLTGTFGAMYLFGYSLDNLSLMALTISTGFVVDDAIVMIENIARHIEEGNGVFEAALKGARQIGFTIVSITVSLLAVFLPILLMGGIVGRLFREFAVTLSVAVAISACVSLTLTPMMSSRLLSPRHARRSRFYKASERFFTAMLNIYETGLKWVLRHQRLMLGVTLGAIALNVYLYIIVPKGFFPQQDTGMLGGFTEARQDISSSGMRERQQAADAIVRADPDVEHANSFTGGQGTVNTGNLFIQLKPKPQRKASADQIIARLRPKLAQVPGINVYLQAVQDVRMGGRLARTQYQYALQDANLDELLQWAPRLLQKLQTLPELKDVASDQQVSGLQVSLKIDRDTAARLGIAPQAIDDTLYDAFGQRQVSTIFTQLNQYHVILEVKPQFQQDPEALRHIYVRASSGEQVPLSAFTSYEPTLTSLSVNHQGQFPAITLSFNLTPGVALGEAVTAINRAQQEIGMPPSVQASFQGTAQAFQSSLASEPFLILAALITVYIVLGMLYESFIHPITILSTLPSAGVGALLALMLFKTEFTIIALIGIILLIGIVKKNAIMMIDFALEAERQQGLPPEESIYQACLLRFRPIMMTTMAALLGGLPLALGTGTGSELRRPLGISIVGGLIISQLLTLYTTPVIYLYMDRLSRRSRKRQPVVGPAPAPSR
ncbi:MAG TPA: multidrug efflux RND transporter permease subunit [Myxococcaceae bacterium]|nr:multidrug efflux RND transporter permease subunit [Myxococcaceae bacterium]